jgi:hypothetical protein
MVSKRVLEVEYLKNSVSTYTASLNPTPLDLSSPGITANTNKEFATTSDKSGLVCIKSSR